MENTVYNIAVISFPRTASKSLAKYYSKLYNKPCALGSLHEPQHLYTNSNCFQPKLIFEKTHILHGHWHSLHNIDQTALNFLRDNYKIVTSYRKEELVKESILQITNKEQAFNDCIQETVLVRGQWNIWKHYIIDGENIDTVLAQPERYV